jgi:beta subunit of N-acylethanolamine-hydrolyzing acid amidase
MRILSASLAVLAALLTVQSATGKFLGHNKHGVKMYSIDLDLPAELRFQEVAKDFKQEANFVIQ